MPYVNFTANPKNETNDCAIRSIAKATGAGVIGGLIGGNGMRHKSITIIRLHRAQRRPLYKYLESLTEMQVPRQSC